MLSVFCFLFHTTQKKIKEKTQRPSVTCWFPDGARLPGRPLLPTAATSMWGTTGALSSSHPNPSTAPPGLCGCLCLHCLHHCCHVLHPPCLSAHWRYQKFQFFKAVSVFSVCMLDFHNGSWPEKVQHLPHTDIGPFPGLGISEFCWSSSDSNFKMFSAAISWQDSTSLPMP